MIKKILYLVMDIVLGSAVNDKQSIIIIANDEEHYSDSDLAHNSPSFFSKSANSIATENNISQIFVQCDQS